MDAVPPDARWPARLSELAASLPRHAAGAPRDAARAELWVLLHGALMRFLRARSRAGFPPHEDLEDIASAKAIDLLGRCESGAWKPGTQALDRVAAYVATAARNGYVDHVRRTRRREREPEALADAVHVRLVPAADAQAEARELARAVVECAQRLRPRALRVWFLRAFHDMTSREIGAHPAVRLDAAAVDVIAQRARDAVRACLGERGHDLARVPDGAYAALWAALESMAAGVAAEEDEP